ncbi:major facilitator superfamily domain-containing protein [Usnea florida]
MDFTQAEEKKLVRKIDLFLLPTIWLMYLLSYIDRTNIGNAKIAGLQKDLHLSSGQYSLSLIVFFITYVIFEVPSNMLLSKSKPSIYLPVIMTLWGTTTCCMSAVKNYQQLVALRVVVGILEAGFAPGVLLIISSWYKRSEQSKRFAVYISAAILSGAFGGLLAGAITKNLEGAHGIRGWRWLFIVEGAATAGWAIISHFILLDFPATSSRLSEREKYVAVSRLQTERVTVQAQGTSEPSHARALWEAFQSWRLWLFTCGYMVIVGSSTLSYFYPTLVEGLGYTANKAQYMTVPLYAVAFVCNAITGYFCDKVQRHRGLVIACWLALSLTCSIIVCCVYDHKARYVLLVFMTAGLWSANALSLSFASSTFGYLRQEVRAVSLAFVNAMGNLAQIYGAYLFPTQQSPKYIMGFSVISAMCAFGVCVYLSIHILTNRHPK